MRGSLSGGEIAAATILAILIVGAVFVSQEKISPVEQTGPKQFSSYDELYKFISLNSEQNYYGEIAARAGADASVPQIGQQTKAASYSTTNIQTAGVDEADIVKNDGKYIYTVSENKIVIIDAYPADSMKIIAEIELNRSVQEIFVNDGKLVVFGSGYNYYPLKAGAAESIICIGCGYGSSEAFVNVYDITDRTEPVLAKNLTLNGSYYDSRMIENNVYVITQENAYIFDGGIRLPAIMEDGVSKEIPATDVYYFDYPDTSYNFNTIISLNLDTLEYDSKTFLFGYNQNMYVSLDNIYLIHQKQIVYRDYQKRMIDEVIIPSLSTDLAQGARTVMDSNVSEYEKYSRIQEIVNNYAESLGPEQGVVFMKDLEKKRIEFDAMIEKERERTVINKIKIANGIEYSATGEVPGYTLNQFSMDEYSGMFRIATTTSWGARAANHLYILDGSLNIIGKLEDIAVGERIYSTRFLGEKLYMVTFRQIDPLFVIDMSIPTDPKILGFLKIPGVSDYLHPYDQNHVIGIGRDASEEGRITGMKIALFDATDPANPVEKSRYIIGDQGTYSEVLNDHKAFLFSREKNLMVMPVIVYEKDGRDWPEFSWQGVYVFNINENGFELKGKITHDTRVKNETYWYGDYQYQIRRSLYMNDILYTISMKAVRANSLTDLSEINNIIIKIQEQTLPLYSKPSK
ncbi:MAG: beta-propeller domain-containing protein [Candidatus Aenigmarchaeota archaeon]|nr:beta-propeller domain-containing protein [Candidatus Aenigmarchaeota archaeon]